MTEAARRGGAAEPEAAGEPADWDLTITVPSDRLDAIFAHFSAQEKANAISNVIQARMNQTLGD